MFVFSRTLANEPPFMLVINFGTRETPWTHPDLAKMKVFTSSLNSGIGDGYVNFFGTKEGLIG